MVLEGTLQNIIPAGLEVVLKGGLASVVGLTPHPKDPSRDHWLRQVVNQFLLPGLEPLFQLSRLDVQGRWS